MAEMEVLPAWPPGPLEDPAYGPNRGDIDSSIDNDSAIPVSMQIRQISIRRYRGIEDFTWKPRPGVNCLIGPGDSFKSTVLAAISLLLAPYPLGPCSEFDFHRRRLVAGFEIEAYIGSLDLAALGTDQRLPHLFGWQDDHPVPLPEGTAEPVLRCKVRGTPDLGAGVRASD